MGTRAVASKALTGCVTDEADAHRVVAMDPPRDALRIPPGVGLGFEMGNLGCVDGEGVDGRLHGPLVGESRTWVHRRAELSPSSPLPMGRGSTHEQMARAIATADSPADSSRRRSGRA